MLKKYVLGSLLVLTFYGSKANDLPKLSTPTNDTPEKKDNSKMVEELQRFAKKLVGIRYKWGGRALKGFDCSGLVNYVFANFGMKLAHSSLDLFRLGSRTPLEEAMPGDLIFFKINASRGAVSHVGIVLEPDEKGVRFIHSARKTGVCISYLQENYYNTRFAGIRRIIDSSKDVK